MSQDFLTDNGQQAGRRCVEDLCVVDQAQVGNWYDNTLVPNVSQQSQVPSSQC